MSRRFATFLFAGFGLACVTGSGTMRPIDFGRDSWRLRIDADSAPTRNASKEPVLGSVDFAAHHYSIDFWRAIGHKLPDGAFVAALDKPGRYKITLGDSTSFDEKIVMIGRAVSRDSIVGTWTETIVCCSAGGRFTLWRSETTRAR